MILLIILILIFFVPPILGLIYVAITSLIALTPKGGLLQLHQKYSFYRTGTYILPIILLVLVGFFFFGSYYGLFLMGAYLCLMFPRLKEGDYNVLSDALFHLYLAISATIYAFAFNETELYIFAIVPASYALLNLFLMGVWVNKVTYSKPKIKNHFPEGLLLTLMGTDILFKLSQFQSVLEEINRPSPTSCFIVTAAGKGHKDFVGSFFSPAYNKVMTRQLIIFYQFEYYLMERFPRFHKGLRKVYNVVGPQIAKRIRTKWIADMVYLLLKPLEYFILLILLIKK